MTNRSAHAAARLGFMLYCLALQPALLWAQNENETVGFRPNHAFESGNFGENIDILNGGLNLTTPIGPHFQVNSRLGYGVTLSYNSKVWDAGYYHTGWIPDQNDQINLINQGPFGVGFTGHFGRIFMDKQFIDGCDTTGSDPNKPCTTPYTTTYTWVSPDGSQHLIHYDPWLVNPPVIDPGPPWTRRRTNDLSYALITGPYTTECPNGQPDGCFKVETPDGLTYTLEKRVDCITPPNGRTNPTQYVRDRAFNLNFCGWYTTLIEDRSTVQPNSVRIAYDTRANFEHAIVSVTDTVDRVIKFYNCEWTANGSACIPSSDGPGYAASSRTRVATHRIDLPAFSKDAIGLDPTKVTSYGFLYDLTTVLRANPDVGQVFTTEPVLKLARIDYPEYLPPNAALPDQYSLYFGYSNSLPACQAGGTDANGFPCEISGLDGNGDYAEITCRTLPLLRTKASVAQITGNACTGGTGYWANYKYTYGYYFYVSAFEVGGLVRPSCAFGKECGASSPNGPILEGVTRHLINKQIEMPQGTVLGQRWRYYRSAVGKTNPDKVTVKDPLLNDTVYFYHGSTASNDPANPGKTPEDGYAPEWTDGSNYQTDYYQGSSTTGKLLRSVVEEHDADRYQANLTKRSKSNVRTRSTTTRYLDDGGVESVSARESWDGSGHYRIEVESGFDVDTPRTTRVEYANGRCSLSDVACSTTSSSCPGGETCSGPAAVYRNDLVLLKEVSDGVHVLSRTENEYSASGTLKTSIGRATLPPTMGSPIPLTPLTGTQRAGDVKTEYTYSANSGNVLTKVLSTGRTGDPVYTIRYTYTPATALPVVGGCTVADECGGYLATKSFLDAGMERFKSIDRDRDVNTGLIKATRDTSRIKTSYDYDALGRVTSVTPEGEEPTVINYASLRETTVTQGTWTTDLDPSADFLFTRYVYDSLGRQIVTQKRPADPTPDPANPTDEKFACQKTQYDIFNRVVYRTDWKYQLATGCVALPQLTQVACSSLGVDRAQDPGTEYDFREPGTTNCEPFGRVRREIPADGNGQTNLNVTRTDYFGPSYQVTVNSMSGAGGASTFSATTAYLKDALGRLIKVDTPTGKRCSVSNAVCSTDTDCGAGGPCVATDGGADAYYDYDALDRLVQVKLSDNLSLNQTRRFTYDGLGQLLSAENPENGTTTYTAYDALGNALSVQDARGNVTKSVYDFAGRLKDQKVQAPGGTEQVVAHNTYDEDPGGQYRGLGKLTKTETYNESGKRQLAESRVYEGMPGARLSLATHQFFGWTTTTPPSETTEALEQTLYTYNNRGQLTTLGYPRETAPPTHGNLDVSFTYSNGSVMSVSDIGGGMVLGRVTYNAAGGVETVETPGNGLTKMTFDTRNRPASVTAGKWGTTDFTRKDYESGAFQYDGAGNISGAFQYDSAGNIIEAKSSRYGYDAANRLVTARTINPGIDQYDESFNYDVFGNIVQRQVTTLSTGLMETDAYTFSNPRTNRVVTRMTTMGSFTSPGPVYFLHDASGNVVEAGRAWNLGAGVQSDIKKYHYGALNRLLGIQAIGYSLGGVSEVDKFQYDPSGDRIWKVNGATGIKTYSVRDPSGQTLSEFRRVASMSDLGEWTSDYVYLAGRLVALKENLRPEPPSGLIATQSVSGQTWTIRLNWNENTEPDKAGYVMYRKRTGIDSVFVTIATPLTATYLDTFAYAAGTTVQYQVSCKDATNYESTRSAIVVISGDITNPTAPTLSLSAGDGQITLSFASTDGAGVLGYYVFRGDSTTNLTQITPQLVPGPILVDLNIVNNTTYYYQVKAMDTSGNLNASLVKNATPRDRTPPATPKGISATSTCGAQGVSEKIVLSWAASPAGDGVVSYDVYRGTTPDSLPLLVNVTAPTYTDPNVTAGAIYYYAVKAVDGATPTANRSPFSQVVAGTARDSSVTPQVQMFVQDKDGSVSIHWQPALGAPAPNPTPTRYLLYRKLNATESCAGYVQVTALNYVSSGEYVDTAVPNNAAYDYALVSVVNGKESSFSRPTLAIPLDRPSNLYQCQDNVPLNSDSFDNVLQWSHPAARFYQPLLATTVDGTLAYLKGYHLYHHKRCKGMLGSGASNYYQDDSPTREVVVDSTNAIDRYRVDADTTNYNYLDPRYFLSNSTTLSPPFDPGGPPTNPFTSCTANDFGTNCVMPKAVYKVYAEGTWLTRESDWPDYFNPFQYDINQRCSTRLKNPSDLPLCVDSAANPNYLAAPTSVSATTAGPGAVKLSWAAPTIAAGKPRLAGFYLYARDTSTDLLKYTFRSPLPFAVVGPGETTVTLTGLARNSSSYAFRVAAFDEAGRVSFENAQVTTSPGAETAQPAPPGSLHPVLWTINDAVNGRGRGGIKVAWKQAFISGTSTLLGFRVYRSTTPEGPYCALLHSGVRDIALPPQISGVCTSDVTGRTVDQDAYPIDPDFSTAPGNTGVYWDQTAAQERTYYYRVSQLENDGTGNRETSFDATYMVAGKGLGYDPTMLPPVQGFRAWAPQQPNYAVPDLALEPDRRGIYLRWCKLTAASDLPQIKEYRVYRKRDADLVSSYKLLARLSPACVDTDTSGNPINRCVIDSSNWCVNHLGQPQTGCLTPPDPIAPVLSAPSCGTSSGTRCGVVDLTFTGGAFDCWPRIHDVADTQAVQNYTYLVTAVTTAGVESMFSNEDHGWLNYCADESVSGCQVRPITTPCGERRDPDGNGDYLVCGDENARLVPPVNDDGGVADPQARPSTASDLAKASTLVADRSPWEGIAQAASVKDSGEPSISGGMIAPHRVIGQAPPTVPSRFVFYHLDHLGSVRAVLDESGDLVVKHNYLPFGDERPVSANSANPTVNTRHFTGHERDKENGLDYMLARYYSSSLGRFMAVDPGDDTAIEDPQSWNKYAYVRNNPLGRRDPDGRAAQDDNKTQRAAQGAAVHAGKEATQNAGVRAQYSQEAGKLAPGDSAGRTALKTAAREASTTTGSAVAEAMRPAAGEAARVGGTASKTNAAVDAVMEGAGKAGPVLLAAGAAVSAYNIATAPEGQKMEAAAQEAGAWTGALGGGAAGAKVGAVVGTALGGPVGGAVGAVVGGLGGAIGGAIVGAKAGGAVYKAVTED